jgi:hypothetical protein
VDRCWPFDDGDDGPKGLKMKHLTAKQIKYLVATLCICLLVSTTALCLLLVSARAGIELISASVQASQAAVTEQNVRASATRDALNETLKSLQKEIVRVDAEMDDREIRLDAKLNAHPKK